jgi:hypothetical protein
MVYRAQAIIDMATEETERARAIREVQRLDPYFDIEDWLLAIEETTLPDVLNAIKNGDTASLREWLSEGAYAQQYAQIKLLQSSGMVVDPTILDIDAPQIVQIMLQPRDQPVFVIMFETSEVSVNFFINFVAFFNLKSNSLFFSFFFLFWLLTTHTDQVRARRGRQCRRRRRRSAC